MPAVIAAPHDRVKGTMRLDKGREREGRVDSVRTCMFMRVRMLGPPAGNRDCVSSRT